MRLLSCFRLHAIWLAMGFLMAEAHAGFFQEPPTVPRITAVTVSNKCLLISVRVPRGWQSVTLDSRELPDQGAWIPRQVIRGKALATRIAFQMPLSYKRHAWRVRGERKSAYPFSFFAGKRTFPNRRSSLWRYNLGMGEAYTLRGDGNLVLGADLPTVSETRQVKEPDIWKQQGDTLYFFNQYRGLQVIDLSDPDAPVLMGELSLPAVGESMVVLDSGHVALLARDARAYDQSRLLIVNVSDKTPRLESALSLDGAIGESRLVGTALYVALQGGREIELGGTVEWQYGTSVISFDVSVPGNPVQRSMLWYPGGGTAVLATDRYLFLALQDGEEGATPIVKVIDIASPDGTMIERAGIETAGRVADKFKMDLSGNVFSVFSETFDAPAEEDPAAPGGTWRTTLQTFSLANPTNPVPLGVLNLAPGERLFATRFDGVRAYAVTFEQVDPLWILDLTNPAQPVVAGEVEVPGWSTYIHPLGDRLVTVGMEEGRVAVSLFDVREPARAALRSRVHLGGDASWSESTWDEKAFSVFPDEGLILVPFEGWSNGAYASQVKLIDLGDSSLTARGEISGNRPIRRTAFHRQRLIALTGKALMSVDVTDRDRPEVKGALELSRTVNRVMASGDYLLQLEEASPWTRNGLALLQVAAKTNPDAILKRLELGAMPVVGACVRSNYLHVLQAPGLGTNLLLTVVDLAGLPEIRQAGQVDVPTDGAGYGDYEAVWPMPELMVWVNRSSGYGVFPMEADLAVNRNPATQPVRIADGSGVSAYGWPWWNEGGLRLLALKMADPVKPEFVSLFRVALKQAWGFSAPFVAQGCVYLSHEQSRRVAVAGEGGTSASEWRVGEFLDVIDFADPVHPTARPPVNIPGQLAGLSPDGTLLYTLGSRQVYNPEAADDAEALCACVYDGTSAYLAGYLRLPRTWPRAVRVDDRGRVFLGRTFPDSDQAPVLEAWRFTAEGTFELDSSTACKAPVTEMRCFGDLLAVQETTGRIALYETTDPSLLEACGEGEPAIGLWAGLGRAWGSLGDGLWIPLDDYGLLFVPIKGTK